MSLILKIFVRPPRTFHTLYRVEQKVSSYLQQILTQRETERLNRTHAYIYLNRVATTVGHDGSKSNMFHMALSRRVVWSRDKIRLHFAQHKSVQET